MSSHPRIAIIGAGPAGLTLARILLQSSIPSTIYDLDPSKLTRDQGGTLDLSEEDGQKALHAANLFSQFKALARPEGQARKQVNYDGTVIWDDNNTEATKLFEQVFESPEIDRLELRNILVDSVPPECIQWGHKLKSVTLDSAGKSTLHFADGSSQGPFDLVVGADGAWSHVRPLLTDGKPYYSGITLIELWALDADNRAKWVAEYVGSGSCFMFDEGRAIMAQRAGHGNIRVYACVRQPEDWAEMSGAPWTDEDAAKSQYLNSLFGDCGDDLKKLVLEAKDAMIVRKLYMLPVGTFWDHKPGVTLIGDAAHLMTPFAGVGVNCAMRDALELATRIIDAKAGDLDAAVKSFEEEMFPRAKLYEEMTAEGLVGHFSKDGNFKRVERLKKQQAKREEYLKKKGLAK